MSSRIIFAVVVAGLFYILGQYIASEPQRVEQEIEANREITVQGTGEVTAVPNVAVITLGVQTGPQASADVAVNQMAQKVNAMLAAIRKEGVEETDIKSTNVSVNPVYDFSNGRQTIRGYEASESVDVKIRKLDSIGTVLARATEQGLNQAGGIRFELDDPEGVQLEAQKKAIEEAQGRAQELADALNVRLGDVKTFNAVASVPPGYPVYDRLAEANALGGVQPPQVPAGSQEIQSTVTIVYEIR